MNQQNSRTELVEPSRWFLALWNMKTNQPTMMSEPGRNHGSPQSTEGDRRSSGPSSVLDEKLPRAKAKNPNWKQERREAHFRRVKKAREVIAQIRQHESLIPNWNGIARILMQERGEASLRRASQDALRLMNVWRHRGYFESEKAYIYGEAGQKL